VFPRLLHLERRVATQNAGDQTLMIGIDVLHDPERHRKFWRELLEYGGQRSQAARRGGHDDEVIFHSRYPTPP